MRQQRSTPIVGVLIELLFEGVLDRDFDDVAFRLAQAVDELERVPRAFIFIVAEVDRFKRSVILNEVLQRRAAAKDCAIIALSPRDGGQAEVLVSGALLEIQMQGLRRVAAGLLAAVRRVHRLERTEIIALLGCLFDHFCISTHGREYHAPIVASVERLAQNDRFVDELQRDAEQLVGTGEYDVVPVGILGGGIERLALELVGGDEDRVLRLDGHGLAVSDRAVVVLCDFVADFHELRGLVRRLRLTRRVGVLGVAAYPDEIGGLGAPVRTYLTLPQAARTFRDSKSCAFCQQGVNLIPEVHNTGDYAACHYATYAQGVGEFHPYVFWELLRLDAAYLEAGHWPSDRTRNHYLLRIVTKPLFAHMGWNIAIRLRNVLEERGCLRSWVHGIVCTGGEESGVLASVLASAYGLSQDVIVQIPRDVFRGISGPDIGPEAIKWLAENRVTAERVRGRNVLVVDQAAHSMQTFSALRRVCEHLDTTILGFAVLVDRTRLGFVLGDYLHDAHYVPLYSWHCPPRMDGECPCYGSTA